MRVDPGLVTQRLGSRIGNFQGVGTAKLLLYVGHDTHLGLLVGLEANRHRSTVGLVELVSLGGDEVQNVLGRLIGVVQLDAGRGSELRLHGQRRLSDVDVADERFLLQLLHLGCFRKLVSYKKFLFAHGRRNHKEEENHEDYVRKRCGRDRGQGLVALLFHYCHSLLLYVTRFGLRNLQRYCFRDDVALPLRQVGKLAAELAHRDLVADLVEGARELVLNHDVRLIAGITGRLQRYDSLTYGVGPLAAVGQVEGLIHLLRKICVLHRVEGDVNTDLLEVVLDNSCDVGVRAAGGVGQSAWVDGVGANARLNSPYQGVFVKNPEYVKANKSDVYDFYFTDSGNHCVRVLTPEGVVTTYAGRGSANLNNEAKGYVDGTLRGEARFNNPRGLAYDEQNNVFYVGDMDNHIIRKIAMEDEDSAHESDEEEISAENTVSNK